MRKGQMKRDTKETKINISFNLEGSGVCNIQTGIGFFDHMLELFAHHGCFDLEVSCLGDTKVDGHHSIEDIGILMGKLLCNLLGDKRGINRYASFYVPMDECLARTVIDLSGRPYLVFNGEKLQGKVGDFDLELVEEFLRAFSTYGMFNLHTTILHGGNAHHMVEAVFKSLARALKEAVKITGTEIPSSKGILE